MSGKGRGVWLVILACANVLAGAARADVRARETAVRGAQRPGAPQERRIAPPPLKCPRDNTTAFSGRVLAYTRSRGRVFVRVRTDEETTEQFTLGYAGERGLARIFRLRGEAFGPGDLSKIESRAGVLRPGVRATVWACYKNDEPVAELIDWRPPEG